MKQARQIFRDAILLTLSALLMRTVGVAFQVAISNRAGAEVMGLYSLMAGVYGLAFTLATSGIHLGVTRLVAEALSFSDFTRIKGILKTACRYAVLCGCTAAILLYATANPIGVTWLSDGRTVLSLRWFALSLPFVSLSSVFNGYFIAVRQSYKNAGIQIAEQFIKITVTMYLLSLLAGKEAEKLLCALVLGGVLSELLSFLINLFFVCLTQRKKDSRKKAAACDGKALLRITAPIAFASYIRSALLTLQYVLIPRGLRKNGASHATSLAAYGCIHSMALPIVLYPAALISSFSGLLIPTLAECQVQKRKKQIRYIVARVWFFSMLFSVGAAGILICFSEELGILLYPNTDTGRYIRLLAPLIPIMYLDTATDAMLKGLGEQVYSMKINILDALLSVILVWTLIPFYGIDGYIVAIYVSELFNTVFSITKLLCVTKVSAKLLKWVYQPLLCILAATYTSRFLLTYHRSDVTVGTGASVFHCCLAALLYFAFLLLTGTVNREELAWGKTLIFQGKEAPKSNSEK